jgi:hypothetical protein
MNAPTPDQLSYVAGLQKKLHLPDALLNRVCQDRFGRLFAELDRRQVSKLLEEMVTWSSYRPN